MAGELSDADLWGAPAQAQPQAVVLKGSNQPVATPEQAATYRELAAAGGYDPNAPAGSRQGPVAVQPGQTAQQGDYFVDPGGAVHVPPQDAPSTAPLTDADLWGPNHAQAPAPPAPGSDDALRLTPEYVADRTAAEKSRAQIMAVESGATLPGPLAGLAHAVAPFNEFMSHVQPLPIGDELAGAGNATSTFLHNLVTGDNKDPRAAYLAAKDAEKTADDAYSAKHPVASTLAQILALPVDAPEAAGAAAVGATPSVTAKLLGYARDIAKGAGVGAGYNTAYGVADRDGADRLDPAKMGADAVRGAEFGGAGTAVGIPGAKIVGAVMEHVGAPAIRTVVRGVNRMVGDSAFLNPEETAASRIAEGLKKDGATPAQIQAAVTDWQKSGASSPVLMNVAGENTRAVLRAAASLPGEGRNLAVGNAKQTAADLQPNVVARTGQLTPGNTQTAQQLEDQLTAQRSTQATSDYQKPYAEQVDATPVIPALTGQSGAKAIGAAYQSAEANKLTPEIAARMPELTALRDAANLKPGGPDPLGNIYTGDLTPEAMQWARRMIGGEPPPEEGVTASVGTLDRLKIAFQRLADDAQTKGAGELAKGYGDLASAIDNHLAGSSADYATARDNYAANSRQIEAVGTGKDAITGQLSRSPKDFSDAVAAMSPEALKAAQVGARSTLQNLLGERNGQTLGVLREVAHGQNMGANLTRLFGPDEAARFQSAAANELAKAEHAAYISPNTGSQTETRASDKFHMEIDPMKMISNIMNAIKNTGNTMTEAERAAIVRLGLENPSAALTRLSGHMTPKGAVPRLPFGLYATAGGQHPRQ